MTSTAPFQAVLGAKDPEMLAIRDILHERNIPCFNGTYKGERCSRSTAYALDGIISSKGHRPALVPSLPILVVECDGPVIRMFQELGYKIARVDHHYPGDPGYDHGSESFWSGSSIGQICQAFGITATQSQLMIAASDHCPADAYRSKCPGVDPEALKKLRVEICATRMGVTCHEIEARIATTAGIIEARINHGQDIPHFEDFYRMLPEASLRLGRAVSFEMFDRHLNKKKYGLMTASPSQVKDWMQSAARDLGLIGIYGAPKRGYAGGYAP